MDGPTLIPSLGWGFDMLSWRQCHWANLSLDTLTLTLALVSRLASGRLGLLSVPVWLVTFPSALHSYFVLTAPPRGLSDASAPWFLLCAPILTFAFFYCAYVMARRTWLEDILVGSTLSGLSLTMWGAMLEAASI